MAAALYDSRECPQRDTAGQLHAGSRSKPSRDLWLARRGAKISKLRLLISKGQNITPRGPTNLSARNLWQIYECAMGVFAAARGICADIIIIL